MPRYVRGLYTDSNIVALAIGGSTPASSSLYVAPSSTAISTTLYFSYLTAPTITGGTSTNAYTLYIAGAPSNTTNAYSLYVAAGKTYIGGSLQIPTGASNNYVLSSDASGNASWVSPGTLAFSGFADGSVSAPGAYWLSQPATGFYKPGSGQIYISSSGINTAGFTSTNTFSSVSLSLTGSGSATVSSSTIYVSPSAVNNPSTSSYYWTYFAQPSGFTGTGATIPNAYTIYVAGVPQAGTSAITNAYSLYVAAGNTSLLGGLTLTGATSISSITGSSAIDFSGNSGTFLTSTGAVTIGSGAIGITGTTTFSGATNAILASGSGAIDFSGNSGIFKTSTGAITIGSGAIAMTGTTTFSGTTNAILATGSGSINFSSNSGTFISPSGSFLVSNSSVNFSSANNTVGTVFKIGSFGQTYTDTSVGNIGINVFNSVGANVLASSTTKTTTFAINFYMRGAVTQGTNQTINNTYNLYIDNVGSTGINVSREAASLYIVGSPIVVSGNTYSLLVASGISRFAGLIQIAGGISSSGSSSIDFSGNSGTFLTSTGAVTIGSGAIAMTGTTTFSGTTNAILASGSGAINYSGNSGTFSTSTGAVTIGSGAIGMTGTTTFSGATNAILASGTGAIDFSGNSGLFKTTTGATTFNGPTFRKNQLVNTITTLSLTSNGSFIIATANTFTITLPVIYTTATSTSGSIEYYIVNNGTGIITISVNNTANESFDGNTIITTLQLNENDRTHLIAYSTGTTGYWYTW